MIRRLLLIRHGRSAHVHPGGWVDAGEVRRWRVQYDAAGIAPDDRPPAALVAEVERARIVVASDLPRAIASAERLVPGRHVDVSPLLREIPLGIPPTTPLRLPLVAWGALIHLHWGTRILRRVDVTAEEVRRADGTADWLAGLVDEHRAVAVVTHGVFRRLLAARLERRGWISAPGGRSYAHWSCWSLRESTNRTTAERT